MPTRARPRCRLTVNGEAYFEDTVTVDAPLEIIGDTTIRWALQLQSPYGESRLQLWAIPAAAVG